MRRSAAPALIVCTVLLALFAGALQPLQNWLTDYRFSLSKRAPTGEVLLVDIDANSLAAVGVWPWPRTVHAEIIDQLRELGAAEIAFDVDFSTASTPEGDRAFEEALMRADGAVILAAFQQKSGLNAQDGIITNKPIPPFEANSWQALVNVELDRDGKARRFSYGGLVDGMAVPSMPAMLGGHAGSLAGEFRVDFSIDAGRLYHISAVDLLNGEVDPATVAGKKIIVGAAAVELRDLFQVPAYGVISGPTLQALATESILQGRTLQPTPLWWSALGVMLIGAAFFSAGRFRWPVALAGFGCAAVVIEAGAAFLQFQFPLVPDTSAWQVTLVGLAAARIVGEIDIRRILVAISKVETANTRTILGQVISDNFAGVVVANEAGTIEVASRNAVEILRAKDQAELSGRPCTDILPPEFCAALKAAIQACKRGEEINSAPQEIAATPGGGEERILEYVVRPSRLLGEVDERGRKQPDRYVATLTFLDITERRRSQARLAYLARFDTLTGLPNRNQMVERLNYVLEQDRTRNSTVLFFFDIDRFKNVNDSLGHDHGDLLLRAVADRVRALIGPDDLAARFGGDEYAIVRARREDTEGFAAELIRRVSEPYSIGGHRLIVGASVGIALPGDQDRDPSVVLKNADTALYRAKGSGGSTFRIYEAEMDSGLRERQALEVDLWEAMRRDEFEVYYQPQVDLATGAITGAEALVRWRHPERGFVSPALFIPVAEAVGLIEPLGTWVLQKACADAASWPIAAKVAVNVSPVQFTRGDLLATVNDALAESTLSPDRLNLEITESLFVSGNPVIRQTIDALCDRGVSFAIDDFGTGYSSLSYISKFPIQKIKIDQSFVRKLPFDRESAAIVRAVAGMAASLEIRTNAEGIETADQHAFLRKLGVEEGQGYLFGKPMPGPEFTALLQARASAAQADGLASVG